MAVEEDGVEQRHYSWLEGEGRVGVVILFVGDWWFI